MKTLRVHEDDISGCGRYLMDDVLDMYIDGEYTHIVLGDVYRRCEVVDLWNSPDVSVIIGEEIGL